MDKNERLLLQAVIKELHGITDDHLKILSNSLLKGIRLRTDKYREELNEFNQIEFHRVTKLGFVSMLDGDLLDETHLILIDEYTLRKHLFYLSNQQKVAWHRLRYERKKIRNLYYKQKAGESWTLVKNPRVKQIELDVCMIMLCLILEEAQYAVIDEERQNEVLGSPVA